MKAAINLARILGLTILDGHRLVDAFIDAACVTVVSISDVSSCRAVEAFALYGKSQGDLAQIKFADCLSYTCTTEDRLQILFKKHDFFQTDLLSALRQP